MKKIICLLTCLLILMTSLCALASASGTNNYNYEIDGVEYAVVIEDENISAEKKEAIAAKLVSAEASQPVPANILCDIFGHDYKYTTASVITHKAYSTSPRCKQDTYKVTYCEDCDYTQKTLTNTTYIVCCAED